MSTPLDPTVQMSSLDGSTLERDQSPIRADPKIVYASEVEEREMVQEDRAALRVRNAQFRGNNRRPHREGVYIVKCRILSPSHFSSMNETKTTSLVPSHNQYRGKECHFYFTDQRRTYMANPSDHRQ